MPPRRRKKRSALDYIRLPSLDLDPDTKKGIWIVFIVLVAFIFLLGLLLYPKFKKSRG